MNIPPIELETRLQARYKRLVEQHSAPLNPLASGLRALPNGSSAFAATQAAWRFFANPKVTLQRLCQPLQEHARLLVAQSHARYLLVAHDWSWCDYNAHPSKSDRMAHSHQYAQGYELLSALTICTQNGAPLAPLPLELESADGIISSQDAAMQPRGATHPEALLGQVEAVENLEFVQKIILVPIVAPSDVPSPTET